MFTPNSSGSLRPRAALTSQAANHTIPLILELLSRTGREIPTPTPITSFVDTPRKAAAADQLKEFCDRYGSDKARLHDYHLLYGAILSKQDSIRYLLEVGLGTNRPKMVSHMGRDGRPGASLRAFRDFLPKAQIYGADIDRQILFREDRIETFFVDQTNPISFDAVAYAVGDATFDLIIDDGLHSPSANLAVLLFGLDRLSAGGWLVVEDIAASALPIWQLIAVQIPDSYDIQIVAAKEAFLFVVRRNG